MKRGNILALAILAGGYAAFAAGLPVLANDMATPPPAPLPPPMSSASLDPAAPITRVGIGSCFVPHYEDHSIWDSVAAARPDLFLFMGDNVYASAELSNPDQPELKEGYALLAASEPFANLRADTPLMTTWDDHDYGEGDGGGDWAIKYNSEKLYEHVWAVPDSDPRRNRDGVYYAKIAGPAGQRVQVIMLDTRFFRSPLVPSDAPGTRGKERYMPDPDPDPDHAKTMLGADQWTWLEAELRKPADLRLIVSSVQVIARGHGWEGWNTLPRERARLYDLITATSANGVIILSGDRHVAGYYSDDTGLPYAITEFTSSSMNAPITGNNQVKTLAESGPMRDGALVGVENFGIVNIDWDAGAVRLEIRDKAGSRLREKTVKIGDLRR